MDDANKSDYYNFWSYGYGKQFTDVMDQTILDSSHKQSVMAVVVDCESEYDLKNLLLDYSRDIHSLCTVLEIGS